MTELNLNKIKESRLKLGITSAEMAKHLGLKNAGNYSKYEKGQYRIRADMLPVFSNVLKHPIGYFFDQNSSKTEQKEVM